MKIKNNIWKFYLWQFLTSSLFIMPVIVLFWQENGISLTQIMFLQAIFSISIVIWEIPTGVIADKKGRKYSLGLASIFLSLGGFIYFLGSSFIQFAIAEFIWGIGITFVSGANSAFVYDSLKQQKKEKDFKKIWSNVGSIGYLGSGLAAILGGFIAKYSLRFNWGISAVFMLASFFVALYFIEPKQYKKVKRESVKSYWKHVIESFEETLKNKKLLFFALFLGLYQALARISLWFYQPYMKESGLDLALFGIVWASFTIFAIVGAKSAHRVESIFKEKGSLWIIIILITLSVIGMGLWFSIFGIAFIFLQQILRGFTPPILEDYKNNLINSEKRATLLSIQGLVVSLTFVIIGPIFGYIADKFSLSTSLITAGISFFLAFVLLMIWRGKIK